MKTFFQFGSFETSPVLGAELTVTQELDNGVLKKATGEERYAYRPLVNPEAGATVKVSYTLTLQGSSAGSVPGVLTLLSTVYFYVFTNKQQTFLFVDYYLILLTMQDCHFCYA